MEWDAIVKLAGFMLEASGQTLRLFFLTLLFGLPLGLLFALGRMSKHWWINGPIKIYLTIMRGTPLILQLMFIYFAPYYIFKFSFIRQTAAVIAFSLNYAAYFAEIYRSGIESIPVGQSEAGEVLGFSKVQVFMKITLPQVIKRVLPPMSNEFMTLVKDTALAQVIGVAEVYQLATKNMSSQSSIVPLVMAGVFFLTMNMVISICFSVAEKKFSYYR